MSHSLQQGVFLTGGKKHFLAFYWRHLDLPKEFYVHDSIAVSSCNVGMHVGRREVQEWCSCTIKGPWFVLELTVQEMYFSFMCLSYVPALTLEMMVLSSVKSKANKQDACLFFLLILNLSETFGRYFTSADSFFSPFTLFTVHSVFMVLQIRAVVVGVPPTEKPSSSTIF